MGVFSVPITLDKERHLKFGYGAMIAIEDLTGKGFFEIAKSLQNPKNFRIKTLRDILWAGLQHEDKTLTPDMVTDLLDNSDIENLIGKINEAMGVSMGEPEGNATAGVSQE